MPTQMTEIDELEKLCVEQQSELSSLRESLRRFELENSELISANDRLEERIQELEESLEELEDDKEDLEEEILEFESPSSRRPPPHFKLPDERDSITHKFSIGGTDLGKGYLICGMYPGSHDLGEMFIKMYKQGQHELPTHLKDDPYVAELHRSMSGLIGFLRGVLDQLAIAVSIGLQRGIPLEVYVRKYRGTRFSPEGLTKNPEIPMANSIVDYIFRWLDMKFSNSSSFEESNTI